MTEQILFVASMHRSGSSLITKGLTCLGVELGDNLMIARQDNPKGFFEDNDFVALNDRLLGMCNSSWDNIYSSFDISPILSKNLLDEGCRLVKKRLSELGESAVIAFKDPRLCILSSYWYKVCSEIGIKTSFLYISRNLTEVCNSLCKRDGMSFIESQSLCADYYFYFFEFVRQNKLKVPSVYLGDFISNPVQALNNISEELGLTLNKDKVDIYNTEFFDRTLLSKKNDWENKITDLKVDFKGIQSLTSDSLHSINKELARFRLSEEYYRGRIESLERSKYHTDNQKNTIYCEIFHRCPEEDFTEDNKIVQSVVRNEFGRFEFELDDIPQKKNLRLDLDHECFILSSLDIKAYDHLGNIVEVKFSAPFSLSHKNKSIHFNDSQIFIELSDYCSNITLSATLDKSIITFSDAVEEYLSVMKSHTNELEREIGYLTEFRRKIINSYWYKGGEKLKKLLRVNNC